jgi:FkbM family methyltransferase
MQRVFSRLVAEGQTVFDIGSNVGFYTLLASTLVGEEGHVVAFEPLPENQDFLLKHLKMNRIRNVRLVKAAVSNASGVARFEAVGNRSMGHLTGGDHGIEVKTVALDDLVNSREIEVPDCIKVDVEGAEVQVLQGASRLLGSSHPTLLLATHGEKAHFECYELLQKLGYKVTNLDGGPPVECSEVLAEAE